MRSLIGSRRPVAPFFIRSLVHPTLILIYLIWAGLLLLGCLTNFVG